MQWVNSSMAIPVCRIPYKKVRYLERTTMFKNAHQFIKYRICPYSSVRNYLRRVRRSYVVCALGCCTAVPGSIPLHPSLDPAGSKLPCRRTSRGKKLVGHCTKLSKIIWKTSTTIYCMRNKKKGNFFLNRLFGFIHSFFNSAFCQNYNMKILCLGSALVKCESGSGSRSRPFHVTGL